MTLGDNDDKELWTLLEFKTFFPQVVRALFARAFSATVLPCGGAGLSEGALDENTHFWYRNSCCAHDFTAIRSTSKNQLSL